MNIPLEILLDYMDYLNPECRMDVRGRWIRSIQLLPKHGVLDPECLYFTDDNRLAADTGKAIIVLMLDSGVLQPGSFNGCIILRTHESLENVFNTVLGYQNLIRDWIHKVEMSVSANEGVQKLLDLSEKVFCNPIVVLTPSMKTLYATWNIEPPPEDRVFTDLYKLGYLGDEAFYMLKNNGYFDDNFYTGDLIHLAPSQIKDFHSVITVVRNGNTVCFVIIINFTTNPMTAGLLELYKYLVEKIKSYLQPLAESENISYIGSQFDYLIIEIIEGRLKSPNEIKNRSFMFPEECSRCYSIAVIELEQYNYLFLSYVSQLLKVNFKDVKQMKYKMSIILYYDKRADEPAWERFLQELADCLKQIDALAGISEPFSGLDTVAESYHQAQMALKLGRRLKNVKLSDDIFGCSKSYDRLFFFNDYHSISITTGEEQSIGVLTKIKAHDKSHSTDYYNILYVYLCMERNYTKSAEILHMHRNNIIYHIGRICKLFSLNLDNYNERLRLLMLYKLDDALQGMP